MAELLASGKKLREIGRALDFSFTTVKKYLDRRGLKAQRKPASAIPRHAHIKREYGITAQQEQSLLDRQSGRCAICGVRADSPRNSGKSVLSIDHDHVTGQVRGVLCSTCNLGLSYFRDNTRVFNRAIEYLDAHTLPHKDVSNVDVSDAALIKTK